MAERYSDLFYNRDEEVAEALAAGDGEEWYQRWKAELERLSGFLRHESGYDAFLNHLQYALDMLNNEQLFPDRGPKWIEACLKIETTIDQTKELRRQRLGGVTVASGPAEGQLDVSPFPILRRANRAISTLTSRESGESSNESRRTMTSDNLSESCSMM